jgi:DNA-binding transcriptional regulator YhcF (GntR family)
MTRVDPNDPRSPYQQIADDLRKRITVGELGPGMRVESTRELATRYGVAPMTIHQAVRVLRDEGLVQSWQGRGTFVRGDDTERPQDLAQDVAELRTRVEALAAAGAGTDDQLADLRSQLARAQAHIMELYARAGLQYQHEDADRVQSTRKRKRAAGE